MSTNLLSCKRYSPVISHLQKGIKPVMPTHDNSGKDEMSLGLLPQARFILTYVNLLASSSVKNPASVTQMINSGCLALCQTVLRLAGPDESEFRSHGVQEQTIGRKKWSRLLT